MKRKIFICYRRADSQGHAGRIYDHLRNRFGDQVFRDVDGIEGGEDFVEAIQQAVGSSDILLAVIGPQWSTTRDSKGRRRLDNPEDFVRMEIETALSRGIRVIPVLVQGAVMPSAEELPPELAKLARRNAVELSERRFYFDMDMLISAIEAAWRNDGHMPSPGRATYEPMTPGSSSRGPDNPEMRLPMLITSRLRLSVVALVSSVLSPYVIYKLFPVSMYDAERQLIAALFLVPLGIAAVFLAKRGMSLLARGDLEASRRSARKSLLLSVGTFAGIVLDFAYMLEGQFHDAFRTYGSLFLPVSGTFISRTLVTRDRVINQIKARLAEIEGLGK